MPSNSPKFPDVSFVRAERNLMRRNFRLYGFDPSGTPLGATGKCIVEIPDDHIQGLMDDLWHHGIRPTDHESQGQIEAMQARIDSLESMVNDILPRALRSPAE